MSVSSRRLTPVTTAWLTLREHGWLAERSPETSDLLLGVATLRSYNAGAEIYAVGDKADGVYGLVEGALDASIPREDGTDLRVMRAEPGFWIGDSALLSDQPRAVTLRAVRASKLVFLPAPRLRELLDEHPGLIRDFYQLAHLNVVNTLRLVSNLSISPSEVRIGLRLLMQLDGLGYDDWIRISHEHLAELTALSVTSLERGLRRLESEGLVETGYGRLRVLDREGLLRFCGDVSVDIAASMPPSRSA